SVYVIYFRCLYVVCVLLFHYIALFFFAFFFFFNATATTEIYTLSLHDAFRSPRIARPTSWLGISALPVALIDSSTCWASCCNWRSEEHTSELQSRGHLVCRLLLEKKKKNRIRYITTIAKTSPLAYRRSLHGVI